MNILLVEDIESKATAVENCLADICKEAKADMRRARSVASALKALNETRFDLVLLDFMLPLRDGAKPVKHAGTDLLMEIVNGDVKIPTHVICLTEYPDLGKIIESPIARSITHIIKYSNRNSDWHGILQTKCNYIRKRLRQSDLFPRDFLADIAIVTSSPPVEIQELLRIDSKFTAEFHAVDALHYHLANWQSASGRNLSVVACASPQMGMTAAAVTTSKLVERWRPRFVAMCGIAASTKKSLKFGDILVGEVVYDYGSGKISDSKSGKRVFVPDTRPLTIDVELKALLQAIERDQTGIPEIMKQ